MKIVNTQSKDLLYTKIAQDAVDNADLNELMCSYYNTIVENLSNLSDEDFIEEVSDKLGITEKELVDEYELLIQ